jgi:hypothetical protein
MANCVLVTSGNGAPTQASTRTSAPNTASSIGSSLSTIRSNPAPLSSSSSALSAALQGFTNDRSTSVRCSAMTSTRQTEHDHSPDHLLPTVLPNSPSSSVLTSPDSHLSCASKSQSSPSPSSASSRHAKGDATHHLTTSGPSTSTKLTRDLEPNNVSALASALAVLGPSTVRASVANTDTHVVTSNSSGRSLQGSDCACAVDRSKLRRDLSKWSKNALLLVGKGLFVT